MLHCSCKWSLRIPVSGPANRCNPVHFAGGTPLYEKQLLIIFTEVDNKPFVRYKKMRRCSAPIFLFLNPGNRLGKCCNSAHIKPVTN